MDKDKKIMNDAWIEDIIDEVKNKSGDYWQKYFENPFYRGVLKRLVKDTRMVKGDEYRDQHQLKFDGINYEDFDNNKFHILLYTLYGLDGDQWSNLHTTYLFILKHIKETQGDDNILRESTNNRKLVEKIAQEIIDATTLTGALLTFYPPIVDKHNNIPPIRALIKSDWIHDDNSVGVQHLTQDIRKIGRQYIKNILGFEMAQRNDPIYKEVNDIVIDNILERARNHDWDKEMQRLKDLKDKHGTVGFLGLRDLHESTEDIYEKMARSVANESDIFEKEGKLYLRSPAFEGGVNVEVVLDIMSGRTKRAIPNSFTKHMKEIYNISGGTPIETVWGLYRDKMIERIKIKQAQLRQISPKQRKFFDHILKTLVDGTEIQTNTLRYIWDDEEYGYGADIIPPFLNHGQTDDRFHEAAIEWNDFSFFGSGYARYMKDIYGLTDKEIKQLWAPYYKGVQKKLEELIERDRITYGDDYLTESKEDKQKEYLSKVVDSIVKNSTIDRSSDVAFYKKGMIFFPWFNFPLSIEDDLKSFFESSKPHKQRPNFTRYCIENFGLTNEEIKIVLDELELIIKNEIEDVMKIPMSQWNLLYESKGARQGEFLNYVLEDLMNNTTWKDASYTILLLHGQNISTSINYDTFTIDWIPGKVDEMFTNMGLDSREKRMIWEIYKDFVLDKMISEGNNTWRKKHLHMGRYPYLKESVDSVEKNKPYLDKVVDKLKHYTTFVASKSPSFSTFYTAHIPFTGGQKWYIEWFSGSLETGYGFKDGFKKEMRDVYGLTPEEIEYVYMKFTSYLIKEFKDRQTKVHVVKD